MRKSILVLAVIGLLVVACSAYAVSASSAVVQIYGKWNQIAAPIIPFAPDMRDNGLDEEGNLVRTPGCWNAWIGNEDTPDRIASGSNNDTITYRDPVGGTNVMLPDDWDYFPSVLMGDGYLARCNTGNKGQIKHNLAYDGVDISDTSAWIPLPGKSNGTGGWHYIGIPYPIGMACDWYAVVITDGTTSHTLGELADSGDQSWISLVFFGWSAPGQAQVRVPDDDGNLMGGQMYKVFTKKSNLALILPLPYTL